MEAYINKKRVRDDSFDPGFDSSEVKRLRDDLFDILDDSDSDPATQDLAFVMKSFEEEILTASPSTSPVIVDLTSDSGESQPDLGYLLEASDDELGLPPSTTSSNGAEEGNKEETEFVRVTTESVAGLGELWGFDDGIPNYEFGIGDGSYNNGEYVALEGLFDYSDVGFGASEFSDFSWRPETMPAL